MTDHDASPPPKLHPSGSPEAVRRPGQCRSMASYDTGESSTAGSLLAGTSATDSTLAPRSSDDSRPSHLAPPGLAHTEEGRRETRATHRTHKNRSSGAFLLSDPLDDGPREHLKAPRRGHHAADPYRPKAPARTPEKPHLTTHLDPASALVPNLSPQNNIDESRQNGNGNGNGKAAAKDLKAEGTEVVDLAPQNPPLALDMDSTQIVNMALNLSESRRLAARRNVTQPLPPRLTPLPDSAVGGSLKQQLQQQRRASRTISPKPERSLRFASGQRMSSPLQAAFDLEGSYRYHFSQSTLARAQKAKDHLELLTQYRRVLELVPPLKPTGSGQTPYIAGTSTNNLPRLGRSYNPLQYIRNRKVRLRERKAVDGEGQGFGDALKVGEWADDVARWAATGQSRIPGSALLPPFVSPEEVALPHSPSTGPRTAGASTKEKRPRIDWVVAPADMLADIYWLEQEDNKRLVEDRHWRRVFPQEPELYRPVSRRSEETVPSDSRPASLQQGDHEEVIKESSISEHGAPLTASHEHARSGAKERARQKLHDLRGRHHRHSSSVQSHDVFRIRKGSLSDSSDTDGEVRRITRTGNLTAHGREALGKQMLDMIARDNRDNEMGSTNDAEGLHREPAGIGLMTPEKFRLRDSPAPSRGGHSRRDSRAEFSESDELSSRGRGPLESPIKPGRLSLEVPTFVRRKSIDYDSFRPTSPELRPPRRDAGFVPAIGADLSPTSSRPGSPTRNPFTKVKSIFRDRSRDRGTDRGSEEREALVGESVVTQSEPDFGTLPTTGERMTSHERKPSRSPVRRVLSTRTTGDAHKPHRGLGSMRLHRDDSGSGLRNFFRGGPRIDTVLRTGASKVSELLWRKDSADVGDVESSSTSSDESETAPARGRSRGSAHHSRVHSRTGEDESGRHNAKHYLDVMPPFVSSSGRERKPLSEETPAASPDSPSNLRHQKSPRFERLKQPMLDIQVPSPTTTPPRQVRIARDSDMSDADSRKSSFASNSRAAGARLNAALGRPQPFTPPKPRQFSKTAAALGNRHWSISNRSPSPERTVLSRREVARLRALMLSSGILAREISCRAQEPRLLPSPSPTTTGPKPRRPGSRSSSSGSEADPPAAAAAAAPAEVIPWADIARLAPPSQQQPAPLLARPVAPAAAYPLAARILGATLTASGSRFQAATDAFAARTAPLRARAEALRAAAPDDLTRKAADEADGLARELGVGQRLKVRRVVDAIEKLHRRRRRRFRWVRRAGWLGVEWVLVGIMWYVWFVVMITRVFLGVGEGVFRGVRWLLWL